MIIDKKEIYKLEESSFRLYAKIGGWNPEDLATAILTSIDNSFKFDNLENTILRDLLGRQNQKSNVNLLLDANRRAAEDYSERIIEDILSTLSNHSQIFAFDWASVQQTASSFGIDIQEKYWLLRYLENIPIILIYTPEIDAYLKLNNDRLPYVVISRSLNQCMEVFVIPAMMNFLFRGELSHVASEPLNYSEVEEISNYLIDVADYYLCNITDIEKPVNTYLSRTLGFGVYFGAIEFALFHEYGHVLLGHTHNKSKKDDEVSADNFAINVLLDRDVNSNKIGGKGIVLRALGVMILFLFLNIIFAISGLNRHRSHPYPSSRLLYLATIIEQTFACDPQLLVMFRQYTSSILTIQKTVLNGFGVNANQFIHLDSWILDKEFSVIPLEGNHYKSHIR